MKNIATHFIEKYNVSFKSLLSCLTTILVGIVALQLTSLIPHGAFQNFAYLTSTALIVGGIIGLFMFTTSEE